MSLRLPSIDWPAFLQRAPGFSSAIVEALCDDDASSYAPHVRAVYCFDLFDAQVSNGGVDQYYGNVASAMPDFAKWPELIAQHAVFRPALPLIEEVHTIWDGIAAAYLETDEKCDSSDACEALLAPHRERLAAIGKAFFAIHHAIRQRLEADIVRAPHHYFAIAPVPGLRGVGVEHVALNENRCRLRFEDGFPVGPNTLEHEDGSCDVIWFSRDRTLLRADMAGFGGRMHSWIHYPSQASGRWIRNDFMGDGQVTRSDTRALGLAGHGLRENYRADGRLEHASLHWYGEELRSEFFYPDGTVLLTCRRGDMGERQLRYWPNGALNIECIEGHDGGKRYLRCLDEEGRDLAPGGTGRLLEMLSLDDEVRQWREGELVNGLLHGPVRRMASLPDGSNPRETEHVRYENGYPQDPSGTGTAPAA